MKVAVFQMDIAWESPCDNREKIERWIEQEAKDADMVILPEMFTTGFTMSPEKVAENAGGESVEWMKMCAKRFGKALVGSIAVREKRNGKDAFCNRLFFVTEEGKIYAYDKRHLFRMSGEDKCYTSGTERLVIPYKGFRIMPLVCYDLRFPVWSRNRNDYDMLIYVANWPESRMQVWKALLVARALENQAYVIGVNRCGKDPNDNDYSGGSMIVDFKGNVVEEAVDYREEMICAELNKEELIRFKEKFPAYLDADSFEITELA